MTSVIDLATLTSSMTDVITHLYPGLVGPIEEESDMGTDRPQRPGRGRMVRSAGVLIRERGVHGVGLREIVAHSGGPRGSLQRWFPGGKAQLISEALDEAGAELLAQVESRLIDARTLADAMDAVISPWRQLLVETDFTLGCPIAATVVDASGNDRLREKAQSLLAQWHARTREVLIGFGDDDSTADDDASVLLAAIEGALILARAQHHTEPLDAVQRFFARSLGQTDGQQAPNTTPPPSRRQRRAR
jgi:TetR/AcrR family transcriptional repressor of lmrAB and yxaGH operons